MNKIILFLVGILFFSGMFVQTAQAQSLTAQYTTQQDYGSGFLGQIKIFNNGSQEVSGWVLSFDFDRTLTSIYDAKIVSHTGIRYTVKDASFNSTIPAGGSVTFGFIGSPGNVTVPPANYVLNGVALGRTATTFSYQGRLNDANAAASGLFDLQFALYDENAAQIGTVQTLEDVTVTGGIFSVMLDFGAPAFSGANRLLEIRVRRGTETGAFTTLAPRQPLTPAPYAIRSLSATDADNAAQLGGLTANQYVLTGDPRLTTTISVTGSGTVGGNLAVGGTITAGCRSGFTAIAGGRLCVSALQSLATFYGANGATAKCISLNARVGTIADVTLALGQAGFDYFGGVSTGWLGDYAGDNQRPRWNNNPFGDIDGGPVDVYTGGIAGNAPLCQYRCVY